MEFSLILTLLWLKEFHFQASEQFLKLSVKWFQSVCVLPLPSLADFAMTSKDSLIHQTTTWKHTHMQKTDHYIHTQWHTHTPEALSPSSISSSPKYDLIPSPVYSGWEREKKLKWKNRVLKMMYCGNCAESTYESKNKSRQIVCNGVNELKNALKALKRLGSWNVAVKSAEKEGQRFSRKSKILAKQREQGSTADARGTLFIKAPRSKGVNAYKAWKSGYAFWTLQEKAKSLKCWDLLTS